MKNIFLCFCVMVVFVATTYSQGTDIHAKPGRFFVGLNVTPAQTNIVNEGVFTGTTNGSELSFHGSLEAEFRFSGFFGIGFGLGYSQYGTNLKLDTYTTKFAAEDSEKDKFDMIISGRGISEQQKISCFDIPLYLSFRFPVSKKTGIYFNPGISYSIPVQKVCNAKGVITYRGYYPQYNDTLANLPQYGFPENSQVDISKDLDITASTINLILKAGIYLGLNSKLSCVIGAAYSQSVSSILNSKSTDYRLTGFAGDYQSLMNSCSKVSLKAMGLHIGIRYQL